jgi:hypothetical protein
MTTFRDGQEAQSGTIRDLLGAPIHSIGEQYSATEAVIDEPLPGSGIKIKLQPPLTIMGFDLITDQLFQELSGEPTLDLAANLVFFPARARCLRLINDQGTITGYYRVNGVSHGFERSSTGAFTSFDAPGAGGAYYTGTFGTGINDAGGDDGILHLDGTYEVKSRDSVYEVKVRKSCNLSVTKCVLSREKERASCIEGFSTNTIEVGPLTLWQYTSANAESWLHGGYYTDAAASESRASISALCAAAIGARLSAGAMRGAGFRTDYPA